MSYSKPVTDEGWLTSVPPKRKHTKNSAKIESQSHFNFRNGLVGNLPCLFLRAHSRYGTEAIRSPKYTFSDNI